MSFDKILDLTAASWSVFYFYNNTRSGQGHCVNCVVKEYRQMSPDIKYKVLLHKYSSGIMAAVH